MAINSKDIETLWQRYSAEGVGTGISVAQYFESNGVPYHTFEKWYKKKYSQSGILDCVVSSESDGSLQGSGGGNSARSNTDKRGEVYVSDVNIGLSNGIKVENHRLSYGELVCFINKLQSLCSV